MTSEETKDPRKDLKRFDGQVFTNNNETKIVRINFECMADMLDARYELVICNNPIIVYDSEGVTDNDDKYVIIEPNRVQTSENSIDLTAKDDDEEDDE